MVRAGAVQALHVQANNVDHSARNIDMFKTACFRGTSGTPVRNTSAWVHNNSSRRTGPPASISSSTLDPRDAARIGPESLQFRGGTHNTEMQRRDGTWNCLLQGARPGDRQRRRRDISCLPARADKRLLQVSCALAGEINVYGIQELIRA
jgi:hypothetical protein